MKHFNEIIIEGLMKQFTHEEMVREYLEVSKQLREAKSEINRLRYLLEDVNATRQVIVERRNEK